ncbi:MAG: hypothetical protein ACRDL4_12355, partial [Thermoleophilaceae bacterium]
PAPRPFFSRCPIDCIRPVDVERYLSDKLAGGLAPTTVVHHVAFLGGPFPLANKGGWGSSNPVAFVDRPRLPLQSGGRLRSCCPRRSRRSYAPCRATSSAGSSVPCTCAPQ